MLSQDLSPEHFFKNHFPLDCGDHVVNARCRAPMGARLASLAMSSLSGGVDAQLSVRPGSKLNEDSGIALIRGASQWLIVADGCTSLVGFPELETQFNVTPARYASHFLVSRANELLQEPFDFSPEELLQRINYDLRQSTEKLGRCSKNRDPNSSPRTTAIVVKISPESDQVEISYVGDGLVLLDHGSYTSAPFENQVERYEYPIKLRMKELAGDLGISPRLAREQEEIKQMLLEMQRSHCNPNSGRGFGVIDGSSEVARFIDTQSFALSSINGIFIGTDGSLPIGLDSFEESDRRTVLDRSATLGALEFLREVKISQDQDPDWQRSPRWKHSDDATCIRVVF